MRRCSTNDAVGQVFAYDITTRNVPCPTARSFIVAINNRFVRLKAQNTYYRGYICHPRQLGPAGWNIRCTRGRKAIRWLEGT